MRRSIRRGALRALNILFNNGPLLRSLGVLNSRFKVFASVFVAYPASADYASFYFTPKTMEKSKWSPVLCAIIRQNSKLTLGFGITSTEPDYRDEQAEANLRRLVSNTNQIAKMVNVPQVTYSGVLPGLMRRLGIVTDPIEADVTAEVVTRALNQLEAMENLPLDTPIIVLGAKGFVGSVLCRSLVDRNVSGVDMGDPWPEELDGRTAVLVNVANHHALDRYIDKLWPGLILLNEVYPEPTKAQLEKLSSLEIPAYHVVGVEAHAIPSMPKAYEGGIPCCAAWPSDSLNPIVRRLGA